MSDQDHISSTGYGDGQSLNPDELQAYLENRLPYERQHAVELWLQEQEMGNDAMEGLQNMPSEETKRRVAAIDQQLRRQLGTGRSRRKRPITENRWSWVAIAIVLLLALLAFAVIAMME